MTTSMADYWSDKPLACPECRVPSVFRAQDGGVWLCPKCGRDCTVRFTVTITGTCPQRRPQFVSENRP